MSFYIHSRIFFFILSVELEQLERNGFGTLKKITNGKKIRMIFFKLHPSCVDLELGNHCEVLRTAGVSLADYEKTFSDLSNMDTTLTTYC